MSRVLRLLGLDPSQHSPLLDVLASDASVISEGPLQVDDLHRVLSESRAMALGRAGLTEADVAARVEQRAALRASKDFAAADGVRLELAARGVMIMDTPEGTTWRPGLPPPQA